MADPHQKVRQERMSLPAILIQYLAGRSPPTSVKLEGALTPGRSPSPPITGTADDGGIVAADARFLSANEVVVAPPAGDREGWPRFRSR